MLKVCTGAWGEDHDTCGVLSTETCEHDFARWAYYLIEKTTALFGSDRSTLRNYAPTLWLVLFVRSQEVLVKFDSFYLSPLTCGESFLLLSKFLEKKLGNLHNLHFAD